MHVSPGMPSLQPSTTPCRQLPTLARRAPLVLLQGNYVQIVIERMQREERLQREAEKQQQQSPGVGVPPPSPGGASTSAAPGFRRR